MKKVYSYLKLQKRNMGGDQSLIIQELFDFAKYVMDTKQIYPYVSFIVKEGVIVSRGYNQEQETYDSTAQCHVVTIRSAQEALSLEKLTGYSLYSFFEPTILGFDVALWSGITDFVWCINASSAKSHYHNMSYGPLIYAKQHPGKITIQNGIREKEALLYAQEAKKQNYYPDNLLP